MMLPDEDYLLPPRLQAKSDELYMVFGKFCSRNKSVDNWRLVGGGWTAHSTALNNA